MSFHWWNWKRFNCKYKNIIIIILFRPTNEVLQLSKPSILTLNMDINMIYLNFFLLPVHLVQYLSQLFLSFFSSLTLLFVLFILWILKLPKILRRKSLKCCVYLKGLLRNIFPKFKIISFHLELFISKFFFYKKTLFLTHLPLSPFVYPI